MFGGRHLLRCFESQRVAMVYEREGNRKSGVALAVRRSLCGLFTCGLKGLEMCIHAFDPTMDCGTFMFSHAQ